MSDRKTLVIREDAAHAKLYRYFQRLGAGPRSKKYNYRENLCHYFWTVVLWWWFVWLFSDKLDHKRRTPPIAYIAATLVTLAIIGIALFLFITEPWQSLLGVAIFVGIMVFALVLSLIHALYEEDGRFADFCDAIGHGITRAFKWFFTAKPKQSRSIPIRWIRPWNVTLVVAYGIFAIVKPWWALAGIAGAVGGVLGVALIIAALYGIIYLVRVLFRKVDNWADAATAKALDKPAKVKVEKPDSFFKVLWHWLVAKKHGFCPLIDIEAAPK